jgi:hypothetical protein
VRSDGGSGQIVVIDTWVVYVTRQKSNPPALRSPGFIDLHQHGQDAENDAVKAADGVTTALELEVGVDDVDAWYTARAKNALINFGASVGHIRVRMAVMRDRGRLLPSGEAAHRAASGDELQQIEAGIEKGLKRGALAVGLGPAYTPGATKAGFAYR